MQKSKHVLSKPGISFTKEQKEVIKSLVEIRKENETQEVISFELDTQLGMRSFAAALEAEDMSDESNTIWIASINKPTNDNPPCETVLMATNEQFRKFAAQVVAAVEAHELAAKTEAAIHNHELDCIWLEAHRIIAAMDKHNETT